MIKVFKVLFWHQNDRKKCRSHISITTAMTSTGLVYLDTYTLPYKSTDQLTKCQVNIPFVPWIRNGNGKKLTSTASQARIGNFLLRAELENLQFLHCSLWTHEKMAACCQSPWHFEVWGSHLSETKMPTFLLLKKKHVFFFKQGFFKKGTVQPLKD